LSSTNKTDRDKDQLSVIDNIKLFNKTNRSTKVDLFSGQHTRVLQATQLIDRPQPAIGRAVGHHAFVTSACGIGRIVDQRTAVGRRLVPVLLTHPVGDPGRCSVAAAQSSQQHNMCPLRPTDAVSHRWILAQAIRPYG
jgi:hypothetical protein